MPDIGIVFLGILEIISAVSTKFLVGWILRPALSTGNRATPERSSTVPTKFCARHIFVKAFGTFYCFYKEVALKVVFVAKL